MLLWASFLVCHTEGGTQYGGPVNRGCVVFLVGDVVFPVVSEGPDGGVLVFPVCDVVVPVGSEGPHGSRGADQDVSGVRATGGPIGQSDVTLDAEQRLHDDIIININAWYNGYL